MYDHEDMSSVSISYRIGSLLRRISQRLNRSVRIPLLFILTVRNWRQFFKSTAAETETVYRLRNGLTLTVPAGTTNINPFVDIWLNHVYDHPKIRWSDVKTVLDIGGHIGAFALYAAKKAPSARTICFEPDPVTYAYLETNVRTNRLTQIQTRCAAIGGETGQAVLHVLPGRSEANSLYAKLEGSHAVPVPVTTLRNVFDSEKIDRCDLLKMNAEGVEYEILYGLPPQYLSRIDVIVMNYHLFVKKPRATPDELRAYLESNGFTVTEQGKRIFVAVRD